MELGSSEELNEVLKKLGADPNIVRDSPEGSRPARPSQTTSDTSNYFEFTLEQDGTYSRNGTTITKGDLARFVAKQLEDGVSGAKVIVSKETDYRRMLQVQEWLNSLGVESVNFAVGDE